MACQVREFAAEVGAPVGAVLEGGYDPTALAGAVVATVAALHGERRAESIAPDQIVTPRVASHLATSGRSDSGSDVLHCRRRTWLAGGRGMSRHCADR